MLDPKVLEAMLDQTNPGMFCIAAILGRIQEIIQEYVAYRQKFDEALLGAINDLGADKNTIAQLQREIGMHEAKICDLKKRLS